MNDTARTVEVDIERILPGGMGLAHGEGLTILVSLAAPGDRIRVTIDRVRGKTAFGSIVEIIKPSPFRVEPPCPYFGKCGGCDFQQLRYQDQLKAKIEIIRDCLFRIARLENPPEISMTPSPREWRYRARANWQIDTAANRVGYFQRGTHQVCDVAECAVLVPELEAVLEAIRSEMKADLRDQVLEVEAVAGEEGVSVFPELAGQQTRDVTRKIGGETYEFSARSFFQINHELLESLVSTALNKASGHRAIDLYSGVGLFTLPLARRFNEVTAVEANSDACVYARRNLRNAHLENATVIRARVGEWMNQTRFGEIDFLLLDPPRTGAEPGVVQGILAALPRRICYVSCDPATLARDLKELLGGGYRLQSIAALDMFPQTHHVETVVQLGS